MDFLKTRTAAFIVLAVVILVMTPLGAVRSLEREAAQVERGFFDGVEIEEGGSKYTSQSIDALLGEKAKAALGLIAAGANYPALAAETANLRSAREELLAADTISEKYSASEAVDAAADALYSGRTAVGISETDLSNIEAYYETLTKIQGSIGINAYNVKVTEYYSVTAARFPADIIAKYVAGPRYFGAQP